MFEMLLLGSLISWGVNALLTPPPPPPPPERPVFYVIEPFDKGELITPVWCDEYGK